MKTSLIIILYILFTVSLISQTEYAVALGPTPVLNTSEFETVFGGSTGTEVKNDNGHIRELEFIAFEGTVFDIIEEYQKDDHKIYKVSTTEYEFGNELYIDSRFVKVQNNKPSSRLLIKPDKEQIYKYFNAAIGASYQWGGNYIKGLEKMIEFYPPKVTLNNELRNSWTIKGVDCSGLIYEATNGYTERNTSKLINFGNAVMIDGLSAEEILNILEPLDMIVWNGHVIYVYDKEFSIQSSPAKGVYKEDLWTTIQDVMKSRKPVTDYHATKGNRFVVRRWYQD